MLDLFQILSDDPCNGMGPAILVLQGVMDIFRIAVPILLIVMGAVDLGKAVMSNDEKEIKGATGKLIKRAIAAAAVFFSVTIVNLVMGLVGRGVSGAEKWSECWKNPGQKSES